MVFEGLRFQDNDTIYWPNFESVYLVNLDDTTIFFDNTGGFDMINAS